MSHTNGAAFRGSASPPEAASVAIDFAIVTAIEVERRAVCAAFGLGDRHRVRKGSRVYWRGKLPLGNKKREVYELVVAQAPDMANVDAAILTNDLLHHWQPSAALLVGIAASTDPSNVKLGDVVVGTEVYYYERGKVTPERTKPEPKIIPADATLWSNVAAAPDWDGAVSVERPDGTTHRPRVHQGVIASGEKVIADADARERIASGSRKILAIAMEDYGFSRAVWQSFEHVRHLDIRGICDDGTPAKDDRWHSYAAATAARFARHFLIDRPVEPRRDVKEDRPFLTRPASPPPDETTTASGRRRRPGTVVAGTVRRSGATGRATLIDTLIEAQIASNLNAPLFFNPTVFVPSKGFIIPELFIQPRVAPQRHPGAPTTLAHLVSRASIAPGFTLLTGPAGIGKSIALSWLFYKCHQKRLLDDTAPVPLFLSPQIVNALPGDAENLVAAVAATYGITGVPPDSDLDGHVFIDGLDELSPDRARALLRTVMSGARRRWSGFLASRPEFYLKELERDPDISSRVSETLKLLPWDAEAAAVKFASAYLKKTGGSEHMPRFLRLCAAGEPTRALLRNPLYITLILFILANGDREGTTLELSTGTPYSLYEAFFSTWLLRESSRLSASTDVALIAWAHEALAFELYRWRGQPLDLAMFLRALAAGPDCPAPCDWQALLDDSRLTGLLSGHRDPLTSRRSISRYLHESIGDFLVARHIVSALKRRDGAIGRTLFNRYNLEVNNFIKNCFVQLPVQDAELIEQHIEAQYRHLRVADDGCAGEELDLALKIKEQTLYYLGRLPLTTPSATLRWAFENEPTFLLRRAAGISATLREDVPTQLAFIDLLAPGSEADCVNRSIELVYYGDVLQDPHRFLDDGHVGWRHTRSAILARLLSTEARDVRLRCFDLRTLLLFLHSREGDCLEEGELEVVSRCELPMDSRLHGYASKERSALVELSTNRSRDILSRIKT
jgi:nucleoside phosphorylase